MISIYCHSCGTIGETKLATEADHRIMTSLPYTRYLGPPRSKEEIEKEQRVCETFSAICILTMVAIARINTLAIKWMKRILHKPLIDIVSNALDMENKALNKVATSGDMSESIKALKEKRKAIFKGK
ncbi:MAG: hypothetical protein HWN66_14980 [Candidatus Helarchaeota archaeon]|nr:hypothetical protein [Candidatus Helarchaeota archaeon]